MTIDEAIEVLELHNQWRKGAEIPMETPVRIGMAIDLVVRELKNLRIANVNSMYCGCQQSQCYLMNGSYICATCNRPLGK